MPAAYRQVAPGRLEVREGGGCLALFGMPFLAAGVAVILMSTGLLPVRNVPEPPAILFIFLMGVAFAAIGGALVFGRKWTTFTAADRTAVVQYGLLVPMREKTLHLDGYTAARVDFVPGDSDSADQYPVTLQGPGGSRLQLFSSTKYAESWERAIAVAGLLGLKVEDATTAHAVQLAPADASLPLQQRARLRREDQEPVVRPEPMRSEISDRDGIVTIVIPAARRHPAMYLFYLIPMAAPILLFDPFLRFFRQSKTPDVVSWFFLGFLIVVFGVLPAQSALSAFLKSRRGRTIVTASTAGVRLDERRVWRTRTIASFAAADIFDIDYGPATGETVEEIQRRRPTMAAPPVGQGTALVLRIVRRLVGSGGVTIKTRQGRATFGQGLEDREVRYLHDVVRNALIQQRSG